MKQNQIILKHLKKIIAIGPESTGKSTLCKQLASHFNTCWVKEYAREFIAAHGAYSFDDLLTIAKGQIDLEDQAARSLQVSGVRYQESGKSCASTAISNELSATSHPLFIDTDMHVMQVWNEFVYNRCHNWILSQIATRKYDGYLLCNIDLPWQQDGMREYPDIKVREKLYHFYREMMINQSVPWIEISGNYEERMEAAVRFVDSL